MWVEASKTRSQQGRPYEGALGARNREPSGAQKASEHWPSTSRKESLPTALWRCGWQPPTHSQPVGRNPETLRPWCCRGGGGRGSLPFGGGGAAHRLRLGHSMGGHKCPPAGHQEALSALRPSLQPGSNPPPPPMLGPQSHPIRTAVWLKVSPGSRGRRSSKEYSGAGAEDSSSPALTARSRVQQTTQTPRSAIPSACVT